MKLRKAPLFYFKKIENISFKHTERRRQIKDEAAHRRLQALISAQHILQLAQTALEQFNRRVAA